MAVSAWEQAQRDRLGGAGGRPAGPGAGAGAGGRARRQPGPRFPPDTDTDSLPTYSPEEFKKVFPNRRQR